MNVDFGPGIPTHLFRVTYTKKKTFCLGFTAWYGMEAIFSKPKGDQEEICVHKFMPWHEASSVSALPHHFWCAFLFMHCVYPMAHIVSFLKVNIMKKAVAFLLMCASDLFAISQPVLSTLLPIR